MPLKTILIIWLLPLALLLGPTFGLVRFSLLVIQWLISTYISLLGKINVNSALCGGKVNRRSATQLVKKHTTIFLSTSVCKIPEKRRKTPPWSCSPSPPAPRAPPPSGQGGHWGGSIEILSRDHSHEQGRLKMSVGEQPRWLMIVASKGRSVHI